VNGLAAGWALRRAGIDAVVYEQFDVGNTRASSHGRTRIFRLAYHHPDYVHLARLALDAWRELESRAGERLLHTTGGIDAGDASEVCADAMAAAGVEFDRAPGEEIAERWPTLRFAPGERVIVQEDAGVCLVKETILAQARLARDAGATLVEGTGVTSVNATGLGVEVETTAEESHRAPLAVLAAGPWNGPMLRDAGIEIALRPTFEQPAHFRLPSAAELPILVDRTASADAPRYAVPDPRDPAALKVGTHLGSVPVEPDALPAEADEQRLAADTAYARTRFAGAEPTGEVDTCLYTMTPDEDFVLDRRGSVVVCSPCSGHGFKFAPLIGRLVADLVDARPTPVPIDRFAASRASLAP